MQKKSAAAAASKGPPTPPPQPAAARRKLNIEMDTVEFRNDQNYFRFHEIQFDRHAPAEQGGAARGTQSYAASYEDLQYLSETVTFKK